MRYKAVKLVKRPETSITPDCFEMVSLETPVISDGEFLVRQTHMSLDPAMKGWMSADRGSYIPPVELGEVMRSSGVGEVVDSRHDKFPVGIQVSGMTGWTEYLVSDGSGLRALPEGISAEEVLCVLALPGLTAYQGLMNVGQPKSGETLVVSGAAGSVGSIVGQIGSAEGLRVVGTAGSDEKCRWLTDELGFDAAINYKADNMAEQLADATPKGVDVYFENTGGPVQLAVYSRMNAHGRVVVCGMIADYHAKRLPPGPNWINMIRKRLRVEGFTMPDHWDQVPAITQALVAYYKAGQIKYRAHTLHGLESAIDGINLLFSGNKDGKLLVKI